MIDRANLIRISTKQAVAKLVFFRLKPDEISAQTLIEVFRYLNSSVPFLSAYCDDEVPLIST
jgi:hypothetical protein